MTHTWRLRTALVGIALALSSLGLARPAFAVDDEERAGARAAAGEGLKAFDEKRFADAVDLFSRAESLVHSPVHLLYIARAQASLGALVKAQETYRKLAREELPATAPAPFKKAVQDANTELKELEPRLPYVTVTVQGQGEAAVEMDGKKVAAALIGVPRPVDPGQHKFKATAPGMAKELSITLKEGERQNVVLTLEPAQGGAAAAPPAGGTAPAAGSAPVAAPPASAPGAAAPPPAQPTDAGTSGSTMKIAGWAGIGLGVVGGVLGTVFLVQRGSKISDGDDKVASCPLGGDGKPSCSADAKSQIQKLDDEAGTAGTMAAVSYVVGGLALAGGITMLVLAPKSPSTGSVHIQPWVGWQSAGVVGRF